MPTPRARIERRIADTHAALLEARSPDVRAFLRELLNEQEQQLAALAAEEDSEALETATAVRSPG
jgi:hypothetical protein